MAVNHYAAVTTAAPAPTPPLQGDHLLDKIPMNAVAAVAAAVNLLAATAPCHLHHHHHDHHRAGADLSEALDTARIHPA